MIKCMWEAASGFVQRGPHLIWKSLSFLGRIQRKLDRRDKIAQAVGAPMTTNPTRAEADNLRRLEEMRATYDRLRTERIRAEGEVERLSLELERARASAKALFGTDDQEEIAGLIAEARARNTERVAAFAAQIQDIEARLQRLGGSR